MPYSTERHNDSCGHLQCITAIRSRERVDIGQPCFNLHGWCPKYVSRRAGLVTRFRQRIGKANLLSYHCIIHQQAQKEAAACRKTMQTVAEIMNLITEDSTITWPYFTQNMAMFCFTTVFAG